MKCSWGCDQETTHQLKSGKFVCQPKHNLCPALIAKRQTSLRLTYENGYVPSWKGRSLSSTQREQISERMKGKEPWNKGKTIGNKHCWHLGKTKETDPRLLEKAESASKILKAKVDSEGYWGCFRKDFDRSNIKYIPGPKRGGGRGKSGWYKGFWCDSSWELAFLIYHLEHEIPISRNS